MENTPFPVQLEFLEFESLTGDTSKLTMQIIYRSVEDRDNMMKTTVRPGLNMVHDRLQEAVSKLR